MRRRYTVEEKEQFWEQVRAGVSVREAARQLGMNPSIGYHWVQQASKASTPKFARLVAASRPQASMAIQVGAVTVRVEAGFDAELLRAVVLALSAVDA